jgi:hypothetical protein
VYRDVLLRRWRNLLGRTMWDFPGGRSGGKRYLVLGLGTGQAADLAVPPEPHELIAYGPLLSDNGATWLGTAVLPTSKCTTGSSADGRHKCVRPTTCWLR